MLFESLGQFYVALIFLWIGFSTAIIDEIPRLINGAFKSKILTPIFDILRVLFAGFIFFIMAKLFLFGEFRVYSLLMFGLGFLIERKYLCKLVAKLFTHLYNYSRIKLKILGGKIKNAKNKK